MAKLNSIDLKPEEIRLVKSILQKYLPEKQVLAFGSRTKGHAKPYSDLDLAVMTEKSLTLKQSALLAEAFEESDLAFKVDVIDWSTTSARFKKIIASSLTPLA